MGGDELLNGIRNENNEKSTFNFPNNRILRYVVWFTSFTLLLFLGLYHQPYYPRTWIDEGFVLQGAINLVKYGEYAMASTEGFRVLDQPLIANGPGVVLPISAGFSLMGVGLLQARLIMTIFLVLTAFTFFILAKRLYGTEAAIISIFLLLAVPQEGFLLYGRHALGNVPALGYFLIGCLLWLKFVERNSWIYAIGTGILFGLALVTKGQYGLLLPILVFVAFVEWIYYKNIDSKKMVVLIFVTVVCMGIWQFSQLLLVGWDNYDQHVEAIRSSSAMTVFAFRPIRIPGNILYLIRSGLILFVIPGLLYIGWTCRKKNLNSSRQFLLVVFVLVWLAWYAFISVGWARYTFAPYSVGLLFAGKFVVDTCLFARKALKNPPSKYLNSVYVRATAFLLVITILVLSILGFAQQIKRVVAAPDTSPQKFAAYLQKNISPHSTIESWEWELDALTQLDYHHPSNVWVDKMTGVLQFGDKLEITYDPIDYQPDYLIDGPFSKWTGFYTYSLQGDQFIWVTSIGNYDLYKIAPVDDE